MKIFSRNDIFSMKRLRKLAIYILTTFMPILLDDTFVLDEKKFELTKKSLSARNVGLEKHFQSIYAVGLN